MSSSAPAVRSSGSGPDEMGDTTLFIATAASYASDGPTLPIIGGMSEHSDLVRASKSNSEARPAKKRKVQNGVGTEPAEAVVVTKKSDLDLAPLYRPWSLLPSRSLERVEKRLGGNLEEKVEVVVWTKNQNVKSGINRLKALLGFGTIQEANGTSQDEARSAKQGGTIAISTYGEGTTKMVGIVEMAKRIVGGGPGKKEAGGQTWYAYTSLTGLDLQARQPKSTEQQETTEEGNETSEKDNKRRVPVLTAWFSRRSIPEFKTTFGEQTFTVVQQPSVT